MTYKAMPVGNPDAYWLYGEGTHNGAEGDYYWQEKYMGTAACNYEQMCGLVKNNPELYSMVPLYEEDLQVDIGL